MVSVMRRRRTETCRDCSAKGRDRSISIFIDADKANIPAYFGWALKLSRAGSIIIVDNVVRDGAVIDASSTDASVRACGKFLSALGDDAGRDRERHPDRRESRATTDSRSFASMSPGRAPPESHSNQ